MSEDIRIKELQDEMDNIQKYPIKLSWKQTWIIGTTLLTLIGSSFGVGMKVQYEGDQLIILDKEQKHRQTLMFKDDEIIEVKRKLKEVNEENIYLTNRFNIVKERYDRCIKGNPFYKLREGEKE